VGLGPKPVASSSQSPVITRLAMTDEANAAAAAAIVRSNLYIVGFAIGSVEVLRKCCQALWKRICDLYMNYEMSKKYRLDLKER
jgi:hypothetical protein